MERNRREDRGMHPLCHERGLRNKTGRCGRRHRPFYLQKCYEIGKDVADIFVEHFSEEIKQEILFDKGGGKYLLDLWKANYYVF